MNANAAKELWTKALPLPDHAFFRLLREQRFHFYALFAVVVLMFLRSPELFWEPRFWAEEANVYYKRALVASWWDTLTYTYPTAGYYSLVGSLATGVAAKLFPLAMGPTVTTFFSLLVQLIPFAIIIWGRSYFWSCWPHKLLVCAVLVLNVNVWHVWLNTINLQSWLGLASALILVERTGEQSRLSFGLQSLVHLVGCLSGPYSLFLAPVFALKALMVRHRRAWFLVALTALAGIYQVVAVAKVKERMNENRRPISEMTLQKPFAVSLSRHFVGTIGGTNSGKKMLRSMSPSEGQPSWKKGLPLALLLLGTLLFLKRSPQSLWLVLAFLCGSVLTTVFSFNFVPGGRYSAFPSFVFICLVVASVDFGALRAFFRPGESPRPRFPLRSIIGLFLCTWTLVTGVADFRRGLNLAYEVRSPVWKEELNRWRKEPDYQPKIWPVTRIPGQWKINMGGVDPNRR